MAACKVLEAYRSGFNPKYKALGMCMIRNTVIPGYYAIIAAVAAFSVCYSIA